MAIIKIKNVTKRFKDKIVLDNISFEVEEGEIFGFIGPNGAGKSTLINIISTILEKEKGKITVDGYDIDKDSIKAKSVIGIVPQEVALIEELNAYDNLEFFGALYGLKGRVLKERVNEALEIVGLSERKKEKVKKFSGGMKRRLNIAAAIMHNPKILIMDEPTVGIDPQSRNYIFDFIKKVNKEKKVTILYTSHYMEEIEELCSKIFIMDLGKEVASGTKEEIKGLLMKSKRIKLKVQNIKVESLMSLNKISTIKNIENINNQLILTVSKEFVLGKLIEVLEKNNEVIEQISYEEVKLEDVFLNLTGNSLRDK
ncbi:ABC transporter ATP-binding protein [Clostridium massiliamazoniense]|uniref:ABC transporter ATP-binding protein n=1 Tax=Clostridium massiliamazoniense TaxID=1347366 RepID=UPI0006D84C89|nr:ABC transporter ATP-binding protein [Clostridium massiliamazoniense]